MIRRLAFTYLLIAAGASSAAIAADVAPGEVTLKISARPLHEGRISPRLFGNFIELLDDVVAGMWAEMLNDRGFEGVTRPANWVYYDGAPNVCDRQWEGSGAWGYEATEAFNGPRCVKLAPAKDTPAGISQSGLAVSRGASYRFSGYLRAEGNASVC